MAKSGKDSKNYDARSFTELFASLSKVQQDELRDRAIVEVGVSRVSFWAWTKGKATPCNRASKKAVCECLRKMGIHTSIYTLWV